MKYLEDLRGIHQGEELWAVGAGQSLENVPLDFFKDKICLGPNRVFSLFLDIGDGHKKFAHKKFYGVCSHGWAPSWILKNAPHYLEQFFLILSPQRDKLYYNYRKYSYYKKFGDAPYWIRNSWQKGNTTASDKTFAAMAKCIMAGRNNCRYFCRGTTIHWAIAAAAVLGAKKISVIGAEGYGRRILKHGSLYRRRKSSRQQQWLSGTKTLARVFKPYGVEIVNYTYGKGEQKL